MFKYEKLILALRGSALLKKCCIFCFVGAVFSTTALSLSIPFCKIVRKNLTANRSVIWYSAKCRKLFGHKQLVNILAINLNDKKIIVVPLVAKNYRTETIPEMAKGKNVIAGG